jgi:hypothetical protein
MSTVLLGGNRFIDCQSLLAYKSQPLLQVLFNPIRVVLATPGDLPSIRTMRVEPSGAVEGDDVTIVETPSSFAVFRGESALILATLLSADTAHLKLDLRPLGINIYDDVEGLHIGSNLFSGNVVSRAATAINLGS